MLSLTLEWKQGDQKAHQTFFDGSAKNSPSRSMIIGRDSTCDLVLAPSDKSVSGQHAELLFKSDNATFYLRNLTRYREASRINPIWVNNQKVIEADMPIGLDSVIKIGSAMIRVKAIDGLQSKPVWGLRCHVCHHTSPYEDLTLACRWCGTSLSAAERVRVRDLKVFS